MRYDAAMGRNCENRLNEVAELVVRISDKYQNLKETLVNTLPLRSPLLEFLRSSMEYSYAGKLIL